MPFQLLKLTESLFKASSAAGGPDSNGGFWAILLNAAAGLFGSSSGTTIPAGAVGATTTSGTSIPDFQTGGTVPGPIGQPTLIRAHGGEKVVTPAQQNKEQTVQNINVTMHVSTPDVEGFRRNKGLILGSLSHEIAREMRRNGG